MAWRRMDSLKLQSENIIARPSLRTSAVRKSPSIIRSLQPVTSIKGTKEDALDYIFDLPEIPGPVRSLPTPLKIYEIAKLLAAGLVVLDPLNLLAD